MYNYDDDKEFEIKTAEQAEQRVLSLIKHAKNVELEHKMLKDHIAEVTERAKRAEIKAKSLKKRAEEIMRIHELARCKDAFVTVSHKALAPSFTIPDESKVPPEYIKTETKTYVDKAGIKDSIMVNGEDVEWLDQVWERYTISARFK